MGNYKLTQEAEADLIRIHQWGVVTHGEAQADNYYWQLLKRFEELANSPQLYTCVDDIRKGYRRSVCGSDSIYYRIVDDTVEIIRILGRQDLDDWL